MPEATVVPLRAKASRPVIKNTTLALYFSLTNIAQNLDPTVLAEIGQRVWRGYEIDENSREDWKERNREAIDLATQVLQTKTTPDEYAANIKYPLLSIAAIRFSAEAYPALIKDRVVKAKITGKDPDGSKASRGERIREHMDYQLFDEMEEWQDDFDALLTALPIEGCEFKKTYFDPGLGRNVSELVRPMDLVVNYKARSLDRASRVTHIIKLTPNEVIEKIRSGTFLDIELGLPQEIDEKSSQPDEDAPHTFLEQHRWWDLDGDGYQEPYIVTIHKDTQKVVRILARFDIDGVQVNPRKHNQIVKIEPVQYFTKFSFMRSVDGGFYEMGFGQLLTPINETINTTTNQLLDAGTDQNAGGGFLAGGIAIGKGKGGGDIKFKPREWKVVTHSGSKLKDNLIARPTSEPSSVLFSLLGFMVEAGEKLSSIESPMMGEEQPANTPASLGFLLVERGLKVFSGVYKRCHRSLKAELRKLYRLNRIFLENEVYFNILDTPKAVKRKDYAENDADIRPVSDPTEFSDTQKLIKGQTLMSMIGQGFNDMVIKKRYLEALQIPDTEELLKDPTPPPVDPKITLELQKLELGRDRFEMEQFKLKFEIAEIQANIIKKIAEAEAKEAGPQVEIYKAELKSLTDQLNNEYSERQKVQQEKTKPKEKGVKK